jgi:hypothetical protein
MQGPKINFVSNNLPLSTLKRKSGLSKTLARKTRWKIDTTVVDISDMAGKLASAFEVLVLLITLLFLFESLTDYFCAVLGINWSTSTDQFY